VNIERELSYRERCAALRAAIDERQRANLGADTAVTFVRRHLARQPTTRLRLHKVGLQRSLSVATIDAACRRLHVFEDAKGKLRLPVDPLDPPADDRRRRSTSRKAP
jgi:hypothetical protein